MISENEVIHRLRKLATLMGDKEYRAGTGHCPTIYWSALNILYEADHWKFYYPRRRMDIMLTANAIWEMVRNESKKND